MAFNYSPKIITDGLILALDAANLRSYPGSGTTWTDLSRGGNNGTLTNGPTFNADKGGNIIFDGTNDYADITLPSGLTTLTIEAFIKWNSFNGGMFLGFNTYDIWTQSNTLGYNNGASNVIGIDAATVTSLGLLGNWKHYVFTMNSSGLLSTNKIHINGVQQSISAVVASDGSIPGIGTTLRLAGWLNGGYNGAVTYGYARGYNRGLTDTEIRQNYNATKTRFGLT
jgi:hypothetical protein